MKEKPPTIKSRPLTYIHNIPISKIETIWSNFKEGSIHATKCNECKEKYYPPQTDCPNCMNNKMEWYKLKQKGKLVTFTEVTVKPQGFTQYEEPYFIAIVENEEKIKILGWIIDIEFKKVKIGMPLKISSRMTTDNYPSIIFKAIKNE